MIVAAEIEPTKWTETLKEQKQVAEACKNPN